MKPCERFEHRGLFGQNQIGEGVFYLFGFGSTYFHNPASLIVCSYPGLNVRRPVFHSQRQKASTRNPAGLSAKMKP
jgi:hypothetical protein